MATTTASSGDKVADTGLAPDRSYAGWKRDKVVRALAEAQHRVAMIPAEKVWRDLGLEG